jgi:hypothetical protein
LLRAQFTNGTDPIQPSPKTGVTPKLVATFDLRDVTAAFRSPANTQPNTPNSSGLQPHHLSLGDKRGPPALAPVPGPSPALHPASVYAGAANGFTLRVDGGNFTASTPGPGSVLLIAGTARTTTCISVTECTAPVTAADVSTAGNLSVQVRNPDNTTSNSVPLIITASNTSDEIISLTSAAPSATTKDIIVVEPTTAGVSLPNADVDLNVAALGVFSTATNSCSLAGNPVALQRPATGLAAADICLFSASGLDTSMTYTVTGPGDVAVIAQQPAGLGIIHLTLQISAAAIPGARTLFIQNTNLDKTAATGALEVQ